MIVSKLPKRKKVSINRFVKKSSKYLLNGEWKGLGNFLTSEMVNIFNDNNIQNERKIYCSLCNYSSSSFLHKSNSLGISWNSACPYCDSRSRHRGLIFIYRKYLNIQEGKKILHFAPEPLLEYEIRKYKVHDYYTTDYKMENVDFPKEDVQNLNFQTSTFDFLLSNHVLEHVQDDKKAVAEMSRVLKPGGIAIITVPGDWRRNYTKVFSHLNFNGHYRDYGLDIINILRPNFVKIIKYSLYKNNGEMYAIKPSEVAFICIK